ncbi:MAG: PDR/VanB family oxidoreductase [Rubrivivax sp.]
MSTAPIPVVVRQIRLEAEDVHSFELVAADGGPLPGYDAGAHVDLDLPGRLRRSYSLYGAPGAEGCWRIAVKREAAGRGASAWLHDGVRVGQVLQAFAPVNDFALVEDAPHSVFVAGGIGITPVLAMIERFSALGRPWQLHYVARTPRRMAFRERLLQLAAHGGGRLVLHFSAEGGRPALAEIVKGAPAGAHLYACGPNAMLDAFAAAAAAAGIEPGRVHVERFGAAAAPATDGGFAVELARDGRRFEVPAGKSVLDVLLDHGVDVPYSCMQGICGSCRVGVKAGEPEHRDDCLGEAERAGAMTVCCSGSRSALLVLDL